MSAGKNVKAAKSKKNSTRPASKPSSVGKSAKVERMRTGTFVETRAAAQGGARKPASSAKKSSAKKDVTRTGTFVETRGAKAGRSGQKPTSRDRMRDGT